MKRILFALFILSSLHVSAQTSADVTFQISAVTTVSPPAITLTWRKAMNVTNYNVYRKLRNAAAWTSLANNLPVNDTFFTDNTIMPGIGYEYRVSDAAQSVTGYIYASLDLPATHHQGKIIVVVDSNYIGVLASEIKTFEMDLVKEGWTVARVNAGRTQSVSSVKQAIRNVYMQTPAWVKGVVLIGHVPVPYSGSLNPDGHPDHSGAWPADLYYCDTSTTYWTDITVNNVAASRPENINIPGDGKFDQTVSTPLMFLGRADMYNMPAFSTNDTMLMQRYLAKDHEYRIAQKSYRMRGLIDDNFGYFSGEAFAQNGFRNFAALLSPDSVVNGDYFTDMKNNNTYLWSYGCGGGWYQGAGGVGNTNNFQSDTVQSVFTLLFGSYFGDWDNQDNFLRAPLASPAPTLTNFWAGRPNIFMHHMGLGEPIGNTFMETAKNGGIYQPTGYGYKYIHQALMGDPTLKMYPYKGPFGLVANTINGASIATLTWLDSPDPQVLGYYVYRTSSLTDSFKLLNTNYIAATGFNDSTAPKGKNIYMVRAVKLQATNTGKFYNLSPGVIDSITIVTPFGVEDVADTKINVRVYPNPATDYIQVESPEATIKAINIYDEGGRKVYSEKITNRNVHIKTGQWSAGNYLMEMDTEKGKTTRSVSISQ